MFNFIDICLRDNLALLHIFWAIFDCILVKVSNSLRLLILSCHRLILVMMDLNYNEKLFTNYYYFSQILVHSWIIVIVHWCFGQSESSLKVNGVHHAESNPKREEWKTRRRKRIGENSTFKKELSSVTATDWRIAASKLLWSQNVYEVAFEFDNPH